MPMRYRGFTLIELIIVIVVLGILAATVLPKFIDLGGDARQAVMRSVDGSMRSANAIIYAKSATAGTTGAASSTVTIGGQSIATAYGFAKTLSPDLTSAMDVSGDFTWTGTTVQHSKAKTPASCQVTYTAVSAADGAPDYASIFSGC